VRSQIGPGHCSTRNIHHDRETIRMTKAQETVIAFNASDHARYPDHAPMRGDDLDRESHDGCDICRWQREGLMPPFIRQGSKRDAR
jgi:hypothetical protein